MAKRKTAAETPNKHDVWISFTIKRTIADRLDAIAEHEDRSRAAVLRRIILKEVETWAQPA